MPPEHGAAAAVQIALLQCERFTDPQTGTPQQHDQRAKPVTVGTVTDRAHDGDDLLNARWIGRGGTRASTGPHRANAMRLSLKARHLHAPDETS